MAVRDHPLRFAVTNELHARPFPFIDPPARVAFVAFLPEGDAAGRDREAERAHLLSLLDRYGAPHPPPGANHHFADLGFGQLKWESHTEFVSYTLIQPGLGEAPFAAADFAFPEDWLAAAPGARISSILVRVERSEDEAAIERDVEEWFVGESLSVARVSDGAAVAASDFRIDPNGHLRMAVFARDDTSPRRVGRLVQRLIEIEVYKSLAMLGFIAIRALMPELGRLEGELTRLAIEMADEESAPRHEETLKTLIEVSSDLEALAARTSWRVGATFAYAALVRQRIEVLREQRFLGRPTLGEFMIRRFDPAMRTVEAMKSRLDELTGRAQRTANLLRTRVDVERSAQNQEMLASLNRRHATQLRLQRTVEGLSVVAISYYAVSLAGYILYPLADLAGISKGMITALAAPPVILVVWFLIHRIRERIERAQEAGED